MESISSWSSSWYRPPLFFSGDIYLCRVIPQKNSIHLEWEGEKTEYEVRYRVRGEADWKTAIVSGNEYDINHLETGTDYEVAVVRGIQESRIRLARTGESVGIPVNYLHPEDEIYSFSGSALCSPSLLRHPDGYLLASMDVYAGRAAQNLTLLFRSDDDGKTWHHYSELFPCFWGKLFLHKGEVYMLSCSTEYGDLLIGKSQDGGKTFGLPTVLLRGSCCWKAAGVHKNPQPVVYWKGKIWESLEWGAWALGYHAPMVMCADENADLLDARSWHFTDPLPYCPDWPGVAEGKSSGNIEGSLLVRPDGNLYNMMRYDMTNCVPKSGLALCYRIGLDGDLPTIAYDSAVGFPGNFSKFMVKRDEKTGKYYSIISRILSDEDRFNRNLLSLMVSEDSIHWTLALDLVDKRTEDPQKIGFQYVDFIMEKDDLLWLCRTAMNGAANFHDANYQTFHVLKDFRKYPI